MAFNLRAVFSADTKDIKKGSKEAQESVKAFEKTTESAIDNVAGLFGTSMSQISNSVNSMRGAFMALNAGINGTAKATDLATKSMNVMKIAIASTGVGALIVALGSLVAYFTKTQRGSDTLSKAMNAVGQVFKTVTDYAIALGEKIVYAVSHPLESVNALGDAIKQNLLDRMDGLVGMFTSLGGIISNALTGKFKEAGIAANSFAESFGRALTGITRDEISQLNQAGGAVLDDFNEKIKRRNALTERIQALERRNIDWVVEQAKLQQQIEQQREIAADKVNKTAEQRLAANQKAIALTTELYAKQTAIEAERLAIIQEENALSESMNKDLMAESEAKIALLNVEKDRASRSKELLAQQAEITNQVRAERLEREKIAALAARKEVELTIPKVTDEAIKDKIPNAVFTMTPIIDQKKLLKDMQSLRDSLRPVAEEFTYDIESTVEGLVSGIAQSMGEMLAGLISGDAKIGDLIGSIAGLIGQAMQQIGAALVAYGVAMDAFKKAFKNPWAAIAAGIALQLAGAALSALIQNSMSGAASATTVGANGGLISGGSTLTIGGGENLNNSQSQVNVNVTGTLKGSGRDLVAVIESEGKRKGLSS